MADNATPPADAGRSPEADSLSFIHQIVEEHNKSGRTMIRVILWCFFLVVWILTGCSNPDPETVAWNHAKKSHTIESYKAFLKEHPTGKKANSARWELQDLLQRKAYFENTEESYRAYLLEFPDGRESPNIGEKLEPMLWPKVKQDRPAELAAFLDLIRRHTLAWEKLHALRERARQDGKLAAFDKTIQTFPRVIKDLRLAEKYAPACAGKPVVGAPPVQDSGRNTFVVLSDKGYIHAWHFDIKFAEGSDNSPLVLILGEQRHTVLSVDTFKSKGQPAPSVSRVRYDLSARLVNAKSGKTLAAKDFRTIPREIRRVEGYSLTEIGDPITFTDVLNWIEPWARTTVPVK